MYFLSIKMGFIYLKQIAKNKCKIGYSKYKAPKKCAHFECNTLMVRDLMKKFHDNFKFKNNAFEGNVRKMRNVFTNMLKADYTVKVDILNNKITNNLLYNKNVAIIPIQKHRLFVWFQICGKNLVLNYIKNYKIAQFTFITKFVCDLFNNQILKTGKLYDLQNETLVDKINSMKWENVKLHDIKFCVM